MSDLVGDRLVHKALDAARARVAQRRAEGKPAHLSPLERLAERPSTHRAIAAKCWDCQGRDADPGVKWRIGNCEVGEDCPLYAFRPHRKLLGTPMPKAMQRWIVGAAIDRCTED